MEINYKRIQCISGHTIYVNKRSGRDGRSCSRYLCVAEADGFEQIVRRKIYKVDSI